MRAWQTAATTLALAMSTGCAGTDPAPQPAPPAEAQRAESAAQPRAAAPSAAALVAGQPAAAAGGACALLDYDRVAAELGERFHLAISGEVSPAATCVLRQADSRYPDLTLAAAPTKADAEVFASHVAPKGSTAVTGLGKKAYSRILPPAVAAGATVEVGWLSTTNRLLTLRYTLPPAGDPATAGAMTPKLVRLAQRVEAQK